MHVMKELDQYLIYKAEKGLEKRGLYNRPEYKKRLDYELGVINKMQFAGYFLIVQDILNWAKENGIYVGPGRGSAAGSLVSYSLRITNLDPIRWNLLFERFLNPDRISMPDIDMDIEKRYREDVIKYAIDKFGSDRVAHIGTFNLMRAKAAVRSVCKTLGHPYMIGDHLSKLLLAPIHGKPQSLSASIERVEELADYHKNTCAQGEILRWAEKVENSISSVGVHPAGIVISNTPLIDRVPLFKGKSGEITTQWEMNTIEDVGLIKFDFLGLDALSKIHNAVDIINEKYKMSLDIDEIPLDDEVTFANLRSGDAVGVFQLEASSGMRDLLVQIRPTSIEDLIALVAIYRPGPLDSPYKDIYLGVRAGERDPEYLVPELEPILKATSGWLIYQEQCMEIAKKLCGYTPGEADDLRKAIGKKIEEKMTKHEPKFKKGWVKRGLSVATGNDMWHQMNAFAAYGFNRSHAAAYAFVSYQTAWLKANYPTEYMCAVMMSEAGDQDAMIKCIAECKRRGIKVLPPDINTSKESFWVNEEQEIRFGLAPIKNLGESPVAMIIEERKHSPFTSFKNFCDRVNLSTINRLKVESLIRSGAFDRFGQTRATLVAAVDDVWEYNKLVKAHESKMVTFHKKTDACIQRISDMADGMTTSNGRALKALTLPVLPERPVYPQLQNLDELSEDDIQRAEHELLGFYVTSHPLDNFKNTGEFSAIEDMKEMYTEMPVTLAAVITNKQEITTKKKKKMAFLRLEDLSGSIEAVCFSFVYEKYKTLLDNPVPLRIEGTIDITEADEQKIAKIKIKGISLLNIQQPTRSTTIDAMVNLMRAKDLTSLLEKYHGDIHEVKVVLQARDGTKFRLEETFRIGNHKAAFLKELARLNNAGTQLL